MSASQQLHQRSVRYRSVTSLHCRTKEKDQACPTFQRLSLNSFVLLVATGAYVCVVLSALSACRVLFLFALLLIRSCAGGGVRAEAVYLQCCMFAAVSCTLYDAVRNALYELSCGLVAEYRLLALSLRACRVRDVVFSGLVFLFCVSVPTIMLHPRLVVLLSMLACVSAVPASEEQSLIQLYKATQVCGCS